MAGPSAIRAATDRNAVAGVASIVAGLLEKGAGERDAFAFADAVEGAGGNFSVAAGSEALSINGQYLARDQHLTIELLADALMRPRFDVSELQKLCDRRIELIKATKDSDPAELIGVYGRAQLFGRQHPFGQPTGGSEASLAAITHEQVLAYYADHFGADRLILVVAGDLDVPALRRQVQEAFGGWRRAGVPLVRPPEPQRAHGRRVLLVDSPESAQTYFWLANVGVNKAIPATRGPRPGEHVVWRSLHFDAQHGVAHQVRPFLQRAGRVLPRNDRGRVCDPLIHGHRQHTQGTRPDPRDARASETRRRDERDAGLRAGVCARAVSARVSRPRRIGRPRSRSSSSMSSTPRTSTTTTRCFAG